VRYIKSLIFSLAITLTANAAETVPGVVVAHQPASTRQYIGSPSIVIAPNGNYIATHDLFGPGSTSTVSAQTEVLVSKNRGLTWSRITQFNDQFWSNLFVLNQRLYLMGASAEYGRILLRTSDDNGLHWSDPHFLTKDAGYHTAPVPVVVHGGRIYRAFEYHPAGPWGSFEAFIMSAPVDADLTTAASWTFSKRLSFPVGDEGDTWLEGNAVVAPDGSILDVLRVNNQQHVAILKLQGQELKLDKFVDFPGGATKFVIRFDPTSKLFWAVSNPALPGESLTISSPGSVRNTLAVMSSPDLTHWSPRAIIEHNPDTKTHAFQYPDWQFDGKDLIVLSRTAFDDDSGGAHSYHDANYLTFHRVSNFRKLGTVTLTGKPFQNAEVIPPEQIAKLVATTTTDAARSQAKVFPQRLGDYGNHMTMLTTRVATGDAEEHQDWSDIFIIVSGEATLVSGGHLQNPRIIAPGEQRSATISGGLDEPLQAGAIVHISPDVPHQLIVPQSGSVSYYVVKVRRSSSVQ
jgi:mannose-6-phosphate isomerase-like protein (cupin superfamily)